MTSESIWISIIVGVAMLLAGAFIKRPALQFPVILAIWFSATFFLPDPYGYAIEERFVIGQEAQLLAVVADEYAIVRFKDDAEPRMVRIVPSKASAEAGKRAKAGFTVIRFGPRKTGGAIGAQGDGDGRGGVELVPLDKQSIITKD